MSRSPKLSLTIDDPLAPSPIADAVADDGPMPGESHAAPDPSPGTKNAAVVESDPNLDDSSRQRVAARPGRGVRNPGRGSGRASALQPQVDGVISLPALASAWRSWTGLTRVASYRLPDELVAELAEVADDLQLPIGLLVTAAITHLLDEPGEVIGELVDRADDSRIQGRRAARRGLTAARGCTIADAPASAAGGTL